VEARRIWRSINPCPTRDREAVVYSISALDPLGHTDVAGPISAIVSNDLRDLECCEGGGKKQPAKVESVCALSASKQKMETERDRRKRRVGCQHDRSDRRQLLSITAWILFKADKVWPHPAELFCKPHECEAVLPLSAVIQAYGMPSLSMIMVWRRSVDCLAREPRNIKQLLKANVVCLRTCGLRRSAATAVRLPRDRGWKLCW